MRRWLLLAILLLVVLGAFAAEAALKHEACTAGQVTDFTDPTFYDEVCQ